MFRSPVGEISGIASECDAAQGLQGAHRPTLGGPGPPDVQQQQQPQQPQQLQQQQHRSSGVTRLVSWYENLVVMAEVAKADVFHGNVVNFGTAPEHSPEASRRIDGAANEDVVDVLSGNRGDVDGVIKLVNPSPAIEPSSSWQNASKSEDRLLCSEHVSQSPAAELSSNWQNASKNKGHNFCNRPPEVEHSPGQCQDPGSL